MLNYIDILGLKHPGVQVYIVNSDAYEDIQIALNDQGNPIGDPLPEKNILDDEILQYTKDQVWSAIKVKRDEVRFGGVLIGDNWYHTDDSSRIQLMCLLCLGDNLPSGIMVKTMANVLVEMTVELVATIFGAMLVREQQVYAVAEVHKAAMLLLSNPDTYDFSTGWPSVFVA